MRVVSLEVTNLMNVGAIEIRPDKRKSIVEIAGLNGAGKSSVIDSIWWAIGGRKDIPAQPIKEGQTKGSIRLDLGEMIVTRNFTAKGSVLRVENKDKSRPASPQALLDRLVGGRSIDPLAFLRADPRKQLEELKGIAGIDTAALDAEHAELYARRTDLNREEKSLFDRADRIEVPADAPLHEESGAELSEKLAAANAAEREIDALKRDHAYKRDSVLAAQAALLAAQDALSESESGLSKAPVPEVSGAELQERLADLSARNAGARARTDLAELTSKAAGVRGALAGTNLRMANLVKARAAMIRDAAYPVPGLGVGETGPTWNARPLAQAGTAEQLRVAVAMAMAAAPELRVIQIRDGSLLDDGSLAAIDAAAAGQEPPYQVWVERVAEKAVDGFTIIDGALA